MLYAIDSFMGKWMPIITPLSVIIGVLSSNYLIPLVYIVPWLFAFMTFSGSLKSDFHSLSNTIVHPLTIILSLIVLHIIMPIWALGIGHIFFSGDPSTITGLVLAVVMPTGITSVIWVALYKGNIPITLSIILIDTLFSPFVVPFSIYLLVGQSINIDTFGLMKGLLLMIVIPTIIGMSINEYTHSSFSQKLNQKLSPFAKLSLPFIIAINSSTLAPYLKDFNTKLLSISVTILFISISGFVFCWILSRLIKPNVENKISLIFTGGMRNISTGVVIAVTYFSPKVAIPVVIGILFQQIIAAVNGYFIGYQRNQNKAFENETILHPEGR